MECKRGNLAVIATLALFFFLYFNLRSLHGQSSDTFNGFSQGIGDDRDDRIGDEGAYAEETDPFNKNAPANGTLGVSVLHRNREDRHEVLFRIFSRC
jgi:hypothetical protein